MSVYVSLADRYYRSVITVDVVPGWLDVAAAGVALLGAIGTVAAALVAVRVSGRDSRDRRRLQSTQISAWMHWANEPMQQEGEEVWPHQPHVVVANGSISSIYEVVITWGAVQGAGALYKMPPDGTPVCVAKVPPGEWIVEGPYYGGGGMHLVTDAAVSFKDSAGLSWRRDAPGNLLQTQLGPLDDLGVARPVSYSQPKRFVR